MRNHFTATAIARDLPSPEPHCTAPKVLLYSHDTFGLGNIRRTLLLAESLADACPAASLLIVTGSPMIHAFRIPPRTDYIKLPCVTRPAADSYAPAYLDSRGAEVAEIRGGVLERAILGFAPDLMIVDKRAAGIGGELLEPLRALRRTRAGTKLVLGIRDILDTPERTRLSLKRAHDMRTIARYYDEVWIYGERSVFDAVAEYRFPAEVARRTRYCGYLKRPTRRAVREEGPPRVLVTTGGGEDGTELIETYLDGLIALPRSVALRTTVVFGPQMPAASRDRLLARFGALADVTFVDFDADLSARYASADLVVSMAGYNTVCELLSCAARAVLVPRARPVGEQLLRARLLAARGLFDVVEPEDLQPDRLMATVLQRLQQPPVSAPVDLDGLPRIHRRVAALLERGDS
jgi:predicted glycosyltransferase